MRNLFPTKGFGTLHIQMRHYTREQHRERVQTSELRRFRITRLIEPEYYLPMIIKLCWIKSGNSYVRTSM